jgi:hypothetical protein
VVSSSDRHAVVNTFIGEGFSMTATDDAATTAYRAWRTWLVVLLMVGMMFSLIDRFSFSLMIDPI